MRYGPRQYALLLYVILASLSTANAGAQAGSDLADSLWRDRADLSAAARRSVPEYCSGTYVVPADIVPVDPTGAGPVTAIADQAEYWLDDRAELSGNVEIRQGGRVIHTDQATLYTDSGDAELAGGVVIRDADVIARGESAVANVDRRDATLGDAEFVLLANEFRGRARTVHKTAEGDLEVRGSRFTRCAPGNDSWRVNAGRLDIPEDAVFGTARNARLSVAGVPVFYTPFIRFPVSDERVSGFLFPGIGYSNEDGLDLSLPYYWNLAPNYDATLTPRLISDRGVGLESEFRHLSRWQSTTLSGAFLNSDDLYDGVFERDDFEDINGSDAGFEPADRWLYGIEHRGRIGRFSTYVDYTAVSDRDYFRNLGTDLAVSSEIQLERRGQITYRIPDLTVRLWAQRFQRLDEIAQEPYRREPELELDYRLPLPGPLRWSVTAEWTRFERDIARASGLDAVTGKRSHVQPQLRLPLRWMWGFFDAEAGFRYTDYDLDAPDGLTLGTAFDESVTRSIGFGSVGGGLYFDRDLRLFGRGLTQSLEPRVYYLYQEFADQSQIPLFDSSVLDFGFSQLFRNNRFAGFDRIGDANQLSVGVTTRFADAATGREYLRASVGQIAYFENRRVTLRGAPTADERQSSSALAAEVSAALARRWRVSGAVVYDPHDDTVDQARFGLSYRSDRRHVFNIGYRKRVRDMIDQTDLSVYWPLSRRVGLIGRWNFDLESRRTIEGFGGLEYNDCCWQIRVLARRFLDSPTGRNFANVDPDEGIFVQIVFKGLAGLGTKVESVLQRGIKGYTPETRN